MDKETLERMLADGMSLERIGRQVGKHPSTVGYWIKKHGLRAARADLFRPRGGIAREQLEALVASGLTVRAIAERLDRSPTTVRHWLRRHGLATRRMRVIAFGAEGRIDDERRVCWKHGSVRFVKGTDGRYRCAKCRAAQVIAYRRRVKERLVREAGGRCVVCGYDAYLGALQFHHLDPATKSFGLSMRGVTHSMERLRAEARKCVLLCSNCHAEVEGGVTMLSHAQPTGPPPTHHIPG